MVASISLTILRQGDTNIIDLAEVGTLIPRSETRVSDAFLQEVSAEVGSVTLPGYGQGGSGTVVRDLQRIGELLFSHLLPEAAQRRLRATQSCDLYLRLDEALLQIPWELCYDGEQFLALKFRLGRQVITSVPLPERRTAHRGVEAPLRVLLIAEPTETLPQARQEVEHLREILSGMWGVEVTLLEGHEVRKPSLLPALQAHDLVHFAGHSQYDAQMPSQSGWLLHEGMLTAGELHQLTRPPVLVFSNSCQAGVTAAWRTSSHYDAQAVGIGSAFLLAGVQNYIGTFWAIQDEESTFFATVFYQSLTAGHSIGAALFQARQAILAQRGWAGFTWASYMLYGDPALTLLPTTRGDRKDLAPLSTPHSLAFRPLQSAAKLAGRESELGQLHQWFEKALNGERQVVFVTGEPGIGKTTVVDAFLQSLESRVQRLASEDHTPQPQAVQTLTPRRQTLDVSLWLGHGQCIEHYGAGEAYLPVLSALGQLCREPGGYRLVEILGQHAPTWLVQMPALLTAAEFEALQRKTLGATRERMLREMAEALEILTSERPLVLWLEDLHWSDYSTLDLVAFLARRRQPARLLVIGTARPVGSQEHPLSAVKQELRLHRQCQELALGFLTEVDIGEYLTVRFSLPELPADLARVIYQRTEGNPLFMVNVVNELIAQGTLTQVNDRWELRGRIESHTLGTPANLHQLIKQQIERVGATERALLEAASLVGMEFSAAAVAAGIAQPIEEVERCCDALVRRNYLLQTRGIDEWPDGTVASRYGFIHALYQEVLSQQISTSRQVRLHRQIGERIERGYGERARDIAAELAIHFERSRDYHRAVQYLEYAGKTALVRSAYVEATSLIARSLELLLALPETPERTRRELSLQLSLGAALMITRGYGAVEVEQTYTRALALCRQGSETPELFRVLKGLWNSYFARGNLHGARELAEELLVHAQQRSDAALFLGARAELGETFFHLGEFAHAAQYLQQTVTADDERISSRTRQDPRIASYESWMLWMCGYPEQALKKNTEAIAQARGLTHPHNLAFALGFSAFFHQFRCEVEQVRERADEGIILCQEHGFSYWLPWGVMLNGWVLSQQGLAEEGITQMQQGLTAYRATGAEVGLVHFLAVLGEMYKEGGRTEEALGIITEALTMMQRNSNRYWEAELYRLKGELLLAPGSKEEKSKAKVQKSKALNPQSQVLDPYGEAEACFQKAIDIARKQQAKSLELRAVMSLSRLWQQQVSQQEAGSLEQETRNTKHATRAKLAEAHKLLSEIYNWFTEGFETKDLQEARALLDALA